MLRLSAEGLSDRKIARSVNEPRTTVRRYRERAKKAGLEWSLPEDLTDQELEGRFFPPLPPVS